MLFAFLLVLWATSAHGQRIRIPTWSPDRPDAAALGTTLTGDVARSVERLATIERASFDEPAPTEQPAPAASDLDINFELPDEPRVASRSGPATLDMSALGIADGFVGQGAMIGNCPTCPPRPRRFGLFAAGLFLRPGGANVVYAIEQTGCDPVLSSPTGQVGTTSLDRQGGLRVGGSIFLPSGAEIVGTYTWLTNDTQSSIEAQPGTVLASQVTHPSQASCDTNSLSALADQEIKQHLIDLDYRVPFCFDCATEVRYLAGIRYARFDQQFSAQQLTGVTSGLATVGTDITFDGLGFRLGLEGERRSPYWGMFIYARGVANFLSGEFNARYTQVNQFGGAVPIALNYDDYRIIGLLETELGVGWRSPGGRWRLSAGYQINAWTNMLTTSDYLRGVRAGDVDDLGETLTFDGLVAQVEWRR